MSCSELSIDTSDIRAIHEAMSDRGSLVAVALRWRPFNCYSAIIVGYSTLHDLDICVIKERNEITCRREHTCEYIAGIERCRGMITYQNSRQGRCP